MLPSRYTRVITKACHLERSISFWLTIETTTGNTIQHSLYETKISLT